MIYATEPISRAISWTEKVLFKPFSLEKWFVMGFCAFLASLGQGGYSFRGTRPFTQPDADMRNGFGQIGAWISAHHALTALIAGGILLAILSLTILFMWLSSRGQFMFLDGVARNTAAVSEPWRRCRGQGDALFKFRLVLLAVFAPLGFGLVGGFLFMIFRAVKAGTPTPMGVAALIAMGAALILLMLASMILGALIRDFVVPIMYLEGTGGWASLKRLWRDLLCGNGWAFVRLYLMKFVLGLASVVLVLIGCCLTCCLGMLPYLSSVVFLPIHVFFRSYALRFLEQFGPEWRVLPD